jgi:hypothetical protein
MTNEQRLMIRESTQVGKTAKTIADTIGVPEEDVRIYLAWWRDMGSPEQRSV